MNIQQNSEVFLVCYGTQASFHDGAIAYSNGKMVDMSISAFGECGSRRMFPLFVSHPC